MGHSISGQIGVFFSGGWSGFGPTDDQTERPILLFQSEAKCFSGKTWVTVPVKSSAVSIIISERVG